MRYWRGDGTEISHEEYDRLLGRETPTLMNIREDPDGMTMTVEERLMNVGKVIMDDAADLLLLSNDVRLTDDRSFTMLAISIIAAVSFVLGVAVGAVMWMLT